MLFKSKEKEIEKRLNVIEKQLDYVLDITTQIAKGMGKIAEHTSTIANIIGMNSIGIKKLLDVFYLTKKDETPPPKNQKH